jgi:hypothetical protein
MARIDPYQPDVVMHKVSDAPMGESDADDNLRKLRENPIWKLRTAKRDGGRGCRRTPPSRWCWQRPSARRRGVRSWAQALVDWRAWQFDP